MLFYLLLDCTVFDKKIFVIFLFIPRNLICLFYLLLLRFFPLIFIFNNLIVIYLCMGSFLKKIMLIFTYFFELAGPLLLCELRVHELLIAVFFSCCRSWTLGCTGFSNCGSPALEHNSIVATSGLSCSEARGIFLDWGSSPCHLHWQQILYHWATREAPSFYF